MLLTFVFSLKPDLLRRLHIPPRSETTTQTGPTGKPRPATTNPVAGPHAEQQPRWRWAPALLLGALGLAGIVTYVALGRGHDAAHPAVAESLAAALDEALDELEAERDPRRAVIAAYARMERLLAAHGVAREPSEAPFEYLGRVLLELETSPGAVFELTALFERAKFSDHTIDGGMKQEALDALAAVRDELRRPR